MISLAGIERSYAMGEQRVHALRAVDLEIGAGEYAAIMGPSGSGKSTLLHVIGLLDRPDAGRYLFDGEDVTALDEPALARLRRDRIGFVFQAFHLVRRLSAAENVALPMVLAGVPAGERRRRVEQALAALGLSDRGGHRPEQLSGGQRQRVAIARATIMAPSVILADEPTGNLDRASSAEVIRLLESLNERGLTLLVVTHDPEIGRRARRRVRLVDGAVESDHRVQAA